MPKTAKQGGFPNVDNGLLRPDANAITDFQSEGPRQFSAGAHGRDAGGGADSGAFKEQIYRLKCRRGLAVRQGRGSGERTGGANADIVEREAIMAAIILNSPWATEMSVYVVRAFVHLRQAYRPQISASPPNWRSWSTSSTIMTRPSATSWTRSAN